MLIELEDEFVWFFRWCVMDGMLVEFVECVSYIEKIKCLEKENV